MNMSIKEIEITDEEIVIKTFAATMFLGLVKREEMSIGDRRDLFEFTQAPGKYGFSKKYTGDIYWLTYAGDNYLIESNFFEKFSELKESFDATRLA